MFRVDRGYFLTMADPDLVERLAAENGSDAARLVHEVPSRDWPGRDRSLIVAVSPLSVRTLGSCLARETAGTFAAGLARAARRQRTLDRRHAEELMLQAELPVQAMDPYVAHRIEVR